MTVDHNTWTWWTLLRAASALNLALLAITWSAPVPDLSHRVHLICATIYTFVCAFRSFFPRVDLERTVLFDSRLSSIALGRSAATVAEMAFTVQLALFGAYVGGLGGVAWAAPVAWAFVPLIAVAQVACWLGVLTLNHRWHAVEESLWALMMALLGGIFLAAIPGLSGGWVALALLGVAGCAAAAWVMAGLDIPMYLRRYEAEVAAGRVFQGVVDGFVDAARRRHPTGSWEVWRHEVAWMTPYFTGCVWLSQAFVWM